MTSASRSTRRLPAKALSAIDVVCPTCKAQVGERCIKPGHPKRSYPHGTRIKAMQQKRVATEVKAKTPEKLAEAAVAVNTRVAEKAQELDAAYDQALAEDKAITQTCDRMAKLISRDLDAVSAWQEIGKLNDDMAQVSDWAMLVLDAVEKYHLAEARRLLASLKRNELTSKLTFEVSQGWNYLLSGFDADWPLHDDLVLPPMVAEEPKAEVKDDGKPTKPRDVACPICKQEIGHPCTGVKRGSHPERLKLYRALRDGTPLPVIGEVVLPEDLDEAYAMNAAFDEKDRLSKEEAFEQFEAWQNEPVSNKMFGEVRVLIAKEHRLLDDRITTTWKTVQALEDRVTSNDEQARFTIDALTLALENQRQQIVTLQNMVDLLLKQGLRPVVDDVLLQHLVTTGIDEKIQVVAGEKFAISFLK